MKNEIVAELSNKWTEHLNTLDIAFQPIVYINDGVLYGVEALLRNHQQAGFKNISEVFDVAYKQNMLRIFSIELAKKTLKKFSQIKNYKKIKLFFNIDNRDMDILNNSHGERKEAILLFLKELQINKEDFCIEISEKHDIQDRERIFKIIEDFKEKKFFIAIDDFGTGFSGIKMLYELNPHIIKVDRFFIDKICTCRRKENIVKSIVSLSQKINATSLAEGVETDKELMLCKELGFSLAQGFFIQKPTTNTEEIKPKYDLQRTIK